MAAVTEIFEAMDRWAPFETQMDFDNAGFLVGRSALQTLQSCGWTHALRSRRQPSPGKKEC